MDTGYLFVFDFDHTLLDEDSCVSMKKLVPDGIFPEEVESKFNEACWIDYMNAIFEHLHSRGIEPAQVIACLEELPMVHGMAELMQKIRAGGGSNEIVIISDSNSLFIEWLLKFHGLLELVSVVYTNPAQITSGGCIQTEFFHVQDWCELSTFNLCKGRILQDHVKRREANGRSFSSIVYVGDGFNDYCPTLKLARTDHVFPRKNFRLAKCLEGNHKVAVANIWLWETGHDIIERLTALQIL